MRLSPVVAVVTLLPACTPDSLVKLAREPVVLGELHPAVAAAQYRFVANDGPSYAPLAGYQARAGRLRVHVAADGLHVVDRSAVDPDWVVHLRARALGRPGRAEALPAGNLWADGGNLDLLRGSVVEYAVNDEGGFEHGYHLLQRPDGDGPVELAIGVEGADVHAIADGALFSVPGRTVVGWRELAVVDADGRPLPATTEARPSPLGGQELVVSVDDRGARWPITIDPLLTSLESSFQPYGATADHAGFSVDAYGDLLVVGNPGVDNTNASWHGASLFQRNEGGEDAWGLQYGNRVDGTTDAREGYDVALDEDVVAFSTVSNQKVRVRRRGVDGQWATAVLFNGSGDFGRAIDLASEFLAVGNPLGTVSGLAAGGTVSLYRRLDGWALAPDAAPYPSAAGDEFGAAVSCSGDRCLVGAPGGGYAVLLQLDASSTDVVTELARFDGPGRFGGAVALSDSHVVVAEPGEAAWQCTTANDWVTSSCSTLATGVGAVAAYGDTVAVVSDDNPVRVQIFETAEKLKLAQVLDTGGVTTATAPASVTLSSTTLAVGLPESDTVVVYRRTGDEWAATSEVQASIKFGFSVGVAGDLVAVGAPEADPNGTNSGEVHLFQRAKFNTFDPIEVLEGQSSNEEFGHALALEEDVLVVGAWHATVAGQSQAGRAEVYRWTGTDTELLTELLPPVPRSAGEFGDSVATDAVKVAVAEPGADDPSGTPANIGGVWVWGRYEDTAFELYNTGNVPFLAGTAAGTRLGLGAVAMSGGFLAASNGAANSNAGQVKLATFTNARTLTAVTTFDGVAGEMLGATLAIDGDLLVMGAPEANTADGRVLVRRLADGDGFQLEATLVGVSDQKLGAGLAVQGDRLFVGMPAQGRAQLRTRNTGGADAWGVVGADFVGVGNFGETMAVDGKVLVVGAPVVGEARMLEWDANVPPLCSDRVVSTSEDTLASRPTQVSDPDGDPLTYTVLDPPDHAASFAVNATTGQLTYTGAANWWGADSLDVSVTDGAFTCEYTFTLDVTAVNDPPVAVADGPFSTDEDQPLVLTFADLVGNDTDVDIATGTPDVLIPGIPFGAQHGTLSLDFASQTVTYQPDPNWHGAEALQYVTADDHGGFSVAPASFTIDVLPVNDLPVLEFDALTLDDLVEDTAYVAAPPGLLGAVTDADGDPLTILLDTSPEHGVLTIDPNGFWRFVPEADWSGSDRFVYSVTDGFDTVGPVTVTLNVASSNDAPVAISDGVYQGAEDRPLEIPFSDLLANDGDVDVGEVVSVVEAPTATGGLAQLLLDRVLFTPDPNLFGPASFEYVVSDAAGIRSGVATVTLDLRAVNDAPVATSDTASGPNDAPLEAEVLTNDVDVDGDPLTASLLGLPLFGTATLSPSGHLSYVARQGYTGADALTYTVFDGQGGSATTEVRLSVSSGDEPTEPSEHTGEVDPGCDTLLPFFVDRDGDGFGDPDTTGLHCAAPSGWVADDGDCDDLSSDVFPGAKERSGDRVDQDCDGRDNVVTPVGACDSTGGSPLGAVALTAALALAGLRRRTS